jgi:hypothetical protein
MWGNRQGWLIAACLVFLVAWPLWMASRPPVVSSPSGKFPELMSRVALPVDPKTVGPETASDECDAGAYYRDAIDEYNAHTREYDKYVEKSRTAQADKPRAVELLVQASRCANMALFSRNASELLNYTPDTPSVEILERLGNLANTIGLLHRLDKKPQDARRYFAAAFALGRHLYNERLAWSEFTAGVNLMTAAAKGLAKVEADENNSDRAKELERFAGAATDYKLKQLELYNVVSSIDTDTVGRHGGDILALARSSPEPMWRGEAILAMGRMKFNTNRRGDQLAASREVQQWVNDRNPAIRAAATAASNLSAGQYRALR